MATSQQDVIKKFMTALDTTNLYGIAALDAAVQACSNFTSMQALINQMIDDCKTAGSADNFLKNYCGIILDNEDTGAITGSDAGGSSIKNAEDIVPESGGTSYPSGTSFTKGGLTVIIPQKSTLTTDQQTVVQGLYSWWIEESLNLIEESYGYSFQNSDATVKRITLEFENDPNSNVLAYVNGRFTSTNGSQYKASRLTLTINMGLFNNLLTSDVNGEGDNAGIYLDRTIAHELTHAIMMAKINDFSYLPDFITEGMAELTHGIDDERYSSIKSLAADYSSLQKYLNLSTDYSDGSGEYVAGYMLLRYLAKQVVEGNDSGFEEDEDLRITNYTDSTILTGSADNETIINFGEHVVINSGKGDDVISNSGNKSSINAGADNDYIYNSADCVTIYSGAGNDTIYNEYSEGGDSVSINAGAGDDSIYTEYSWSLTIDGGAGDDTITINRGSKNSINGGAGNDKINLDSTEGISTIKGGAGNDTIYGNSNYGVIYQYASGEGDDTIYGFSPKDTLNITRGTYTTLKSGNDFVVNVGSGKITLKDVYTEEYYRIQIKDANGNLVKINDWSIMSGTSDNDSLVNISDDVTVNALAGNDDIENYGANVSINAGAGNDYIYNSSFYSTIDAGAGADTIEDEGYNTVIDGGAGNDSIYTWTIYSLINGGAGDDKITLRSEGAGNTVSGGLGDDTVSLGGSTTYGRIYQYANGDGNDVIFGYSENDTIQIVLGDDVHTYTTTASGSSDIKLNIGTGSILFKNAQVQTLNIETVEGSESGESNASWTTITGTAKVDTLSNSTSHVVIEALASNDNISNTGASVSINAGTGNDKITLAGEAENVTVYGGTGNDTIYSDNVGHLYQYNSGDGKDVITGFNENDTVQIISGSISSASLKSSDFIINVGNGSLTLKNVTLGTTFTTVDSSGNSGTISMPKVVFTEKVDSYTNEYDNENLNALGGNDSIENYGLNVTLNGGKGNDYLYNVGEESSIFGGAGKDTIENFAADVTIDGGTEADYIYNDGDNAVIDGGTGNDTIENFGGGTLFKYANGGGKDVIIGFGEYDGLQITSGSIKSTSAKGTNVILNVGNGSITLEDMAGKYINLADSSGTVTNTIFGGIIEGTDKADNIESDRNLMTIKGAAGNDTIINTGFSVTIDGGSGSDTIYNEGEDSSILGGAGNDLIVNYGANDTIDGGAGHDKIFIDSEVTVRGGKGNDTITATGDNIFFQYASGDGKDVIYGFDENDTIQITSGTVKNTLESGNDIIINIGGGSITLKDYAGYDLTIDNNFITSNAQLADIIEITADNYSIAEIQTAHFKPFAQDNYQLSVNSNK